MHMAVFFRKTPLKKFSTVLAIGLASGLPLLFAQSVSADSSQEQAKKIYAVQCALCHGTGRRSGVETVQLYLHERYTPVAIPVKNLRGFQRATLSPGETKTVTMKLTPEDLMLLNEDMHWKVVPGTFDVMIGKSSADIVLTRPLQVESPRHGGQARGK